VTGLALVLAGVPAAHASDGFEIMPSVGIGQPTGDGSDGYSPAFHLGLSLGGRFDPRFSLHGQFAYDRLGVDNYRGASLNGYVARLLVVPSLHLVQDRFDVALGPVLGLYAISTRSEGLGVQVKGSFRGRQLGVESMVLYTLNRYMALGPVVSYARMWLTNACLQVTGLAESCDGDPASADHGFWNVGVAARF